MRAPYIHRNEKRGAGEIRLAETSTLTLAAVLVPHILAAVGTCQIIEDERAKENGEGSGGGIHIDERAV